MKKLLEVALVLSAVDKATRVVDEATRQQLNKLNELNSKASNLFAKGAGLSAAGVALAAPLFSATEAAIAFEDKMADVGKVLNLKTGSAELGKIGDQVKTMSEYLAQTPDQVAGLYASLAQGGIAASDLNEVAKIAGEMAVAFDMLPDQAGDAFIKMRNAMNLTIADAEKAVDAMNFLSDTTAAKASEILTFMSSGGASVAGTLKTGAPLMQGFGATLISIGKSGAEAATIMERFQKGVLSNAEIAPIFKAAGGGVNGLLTVLKHGSKLTGDEQFKYFANFGEYGTSVAALAQNFDLLFGTLKSVNNETAYYNSATNEFVNRSSTTQGQINTLMTTLKVGVIEFGETFLPAINAMLAAVTPLVKSISQFAKEHPTLMKYVGVFTAITSAVLIGAGAFFVIKGAAVALTTVLMANPIIAIITGIAMAAYLIYDNWGAISTWFTGLWNTVTAAFTAAWNWIVDFFMNYTLLGLIIQHWGDITAIAVKFYDMGKNIVMAIFDGIKAFAMKPIEAITELGDTIANKFKSILGIKSPSRVFMDFGKNVTAGAALGIAAGIPMAANASANLANVVAPPSISVPAAPASTSGPGGGGAMSINYSPSITFQGGATAEAREDFTKLLQKHQADIARIMEDYNSRQARRQF